MRRSFLAPLCVVLAAAALPACSGAGLSASPSASARLSSVIPQAAQIKPSSLRGFAKKNTTAAATPVPSATPVVLKTTASVRGLVRMEPRAPEPPGPFDPEPYGH
jgi:hypothetical protein